jgi:D-alanyl-D-alanine carboxypeptidase-like protein
VQRIEIRSAYRSATEQFANWQRAFPRYYTETRNMRTGLNGGEHGAEAVRYFASYIGKRLAAPGYSLHNNGLAVDFTTVESGHELGPSSSQKSLGDWKLSWLWQWLGGNAATYGFFQNTSINEPWHWEYRRGTGRSESEALAVTSGREELSNVLLLSQHRGMQPNLILRWNDMQAAPASVDIVFHYHGYSDRRDTMSLPRRRSRTADSTSSIPIPFEHRPDSPDLVHPTARQLGTRQDL